eukprot:GDKK01040148.1.p1 GENE.GDKK01040148.1~~GDKK01040148.1.p1  ORF type:complete len:540 (-),score=52.08 GDKK01040148.1:236-1795(-)
MCLTFLTLRRIKSPGIGPLQLRREFQPDAPKCPNSAGDGFYVIRWRLGFGSFGHVYEAAFIGSDGNVKPRVALKVMEYDEKVVEEVNAQLCCSTHPNVVELYESFPFRTYMIMSMEYCDGSVRDTFFRSSRRTIISESLILLVCRDVLRALAFMHENRIVHRDLKCANILCDPNGLRFKIGDFGVTHCSFRNTRISNVAGTVRWFSPELGQVYKHSLMRSTTPIPEIDYYKCDIYALGICVYEMATSYVPYASMKTEDVIEILTSADFQPPSLKTESTVVYTDEMFSQRDPSLNVDGQKVFNNDEFFKTHMQEIRDFSPEFHNFLAKLLEKNPQKRLNAVDLLEDPYLNQKAEEYEHMYTSEKIWAAQRLDFLAKKAKHTPLTLEESWEFEKLNQPENRIWDDAVRLETKKCNAALLYPPTPSPSTRPSSTPRPRRATWPRSSRRSPPPWPRPSWSSPRTRTCTASSSRRTPSSPPSRRSPSSPRSCWPTTCSSTATLRSAPRTTTPSTATAATTPSSA